MTVGQDGRAEGIRLLRESAAAISPRGGPLGRIRALRDTEAGFDPAVLAEMGALGWLGLRVAEEAGGAGLGMVELAALAEEMGHGLVPEPLAAIAAVSAPLMPGQDVIAGSRVLLPAWAERPHTLDAEGATTVLGHHVSGTKTAVPMALGGDGFLVTARDGASLSVVLVEKGAPGVTLTAEPTVDGGHLGTLSLDHAPCTPVAEDAGARVARLLDEAAVATAAELVGLMERALTITLEFLCTREQFGRPIGSFQVLQHRAADLRIQLELARAAVGHAAAVCDAVHGSGAPSPQREAAVSLAKARASDAALLITRQAIQLHGGIGYTDEADIGLFLRRAMVLAVSFGTAAAHRRRYAAVAPPLDIDA